ncbi:MAG: response regulator [Chloroflexi bacterium]|nr:response regulator [Chloroflexota bacterium]
MAQILIVDDEFLTTEMLATFIGIIGHQATEAYSGHEMWMKLNYLAPDAILLDIMLPDSNGLELCRALRNDPKTSHVPIIIISAHAPPMTREADDAGADAYLVKPISLQALRNVLAEVGVGQSAQKAKD